MAGNLQVGTPLLSRKPPVFGMLYHGTTGGVTVTCVVRGGSWQETDDTKSDEEMNEVEETFNVIRYDRGERAKCDLFPGATGGVTFFPEVNDVLEETTQSASDATAAGVCIWEAGGKRRYTLVSPVERKQFGKRAVIYSVTLLRKNALDTTKITVDSY